MRIAVLSRRPELYSTRRLLESVAQAGAEALLLDPGACAVEIRDGRSRLLAGGAEVPPVVAVIPRIGSQISRFGAYLLRYFAQTGAFCLNDAAPLELARDKFASLLALSACGVPVPPTVLPGGPAAADLCVGRLGNPLVLKLTQGSQGIGVVLAESPAAARSAVDAFLQLGAEFLAQGYLPGRRDYRLLVLDGQVLAAMMRSAAPEDFRSNLHRGGHAEAYSPGVEMAALAVRAAACLGLRFAGVDIMEDGAGRPVVLEVNPVPSLEGIERVSGADIAARLVSYVLDRRATAGAAP